MISNQHPDLLIVARVASRAGVNFHPNRAETRSVTLCLSRQPLSGWNRRFNLGAEGESLDGLIFFFVTDGDRCQFIGGIAKAPERLCRILGIAPPSEES